MVLQIVLICCAFPYGAWGQENFVLLSVEKHDEVNVTRLTLQFNRLPEFQVKTSGQRLDIVLPETQASSNTQLPPEDERLVRVLIGQAQKKLMLSFLLRRPPYFVNSVKDVQDHRLVVDLHWQDSQRGTRPAISRSLPGQSSIQSGGGVAGRGINSKYRGDWQRFFAEYERPVKLGAHINYTLAPFPCLALVDDVFDVLPLDVAALADSEDWDAAITALNYVGLEAERGDAPLRLMLIKADLHQRAGNYKKARRFLARIDRLLSDEQKDLAACVSLQRLYLASDQVRDPYELLAELTLAVDQRYPIAMQKYLDLFQAEVLIASGDVQQSNPILQGALLEGVGDLESLYRLRLADVAAIRGDHKGAINRYLALDDQLVGQPFSLAAYATSLYRDKQYDATIETIKTLLEDLDDSDHRDLARYMMGLALIHRGDGGAGYDLLHQILPGTIGAILAKAKIADLGIQTDDFYSRRRSLNEFEMLVDMMPTRSGRAEMQFKHAVATYLLGHRMAAIDELQLFLRSDRMTDLVPHAQALLVEILPGVIHDLVEGEKYFKALVLVEQNRDLLVTSQKNFSFLVELGQVFSELEFSERAVRLYLYLMDVTSVGDRQEQVYRPLIEALSQQDDYQRVLDYAGRYETLYPQGESRAEVFLAKVEALQKLERNGEAQLLLDDPKRPQSHEINRLAATLDLQNNLLESAALSIAKVVGSDMTQAASEDVLLQAEIMLKQNKRSNALGLYRYLKTVAEFADQAQYREASILLQQGSKKAGLNLLEQLVENSSDGPWKTLAQETLQIERFNR